MRFAMLILFGTLVGCTTAQKPAPQQPSLAEEEEGPATRKVRERQEQMEEELDFTLGEPVSPRLRERLQDDRFTKSYGRPR